MHKLLKQLGFQSPVERITLLAALEDPMALDALAQTEVPEAVAVEEAAEASSSSPSQSLGSRPADAQNSPIEHRWLVVVWKIRTNYGGGGADYISEFRYHSWEQVG